MFTRASSIAWNAAAPRLLSSASLKVANQNVLSMWRKVSCCPSIWMPYRDNSGVSALSPPTLPSASPFVRGTLQSRAFSKTAGPTQQQEQQQTAAAASPDLVKDVLAQYDTASAMAFYQQVMGGGEEGGNIHYGIFRSPTDGVREAGHNVVDFLGDLMAWASTMPLGASTRLLDVGSGHGGAALRNAARFGLHATGFNVCPAQNEHFEQVALKRGIRDQVATVAGNFDQPFPAHWNNHFDVVWSQEAFCHSQDKQTLLRRVQGVLRPGGLLAFTDIMSGENVKDAAQLKTFTDRNATTNMARPSDYLRWLEEAGLSYTTYFDLTNHLPLFFQGMIDEIENNYETLVAKGVAPHYLDNFHTSLSERIGFARNGCFAWGAFISRKPDGTMSSTMAPAVLSGSMPLERGIQTDRIYGRADDRLGKAHAKAAPAASAAAPRGINAYRNVLVAGGGHIGAFVARQAACNMPPSTKVYLKVRSEKHVSPHVRELCKKHDITIVSKVSDLEGIDFVVVTTKTFDHHTVMQEIAPLFKANPRAECLLVHNGVMLNEDSLVPGGIVHARAVTVGSYDFDSKAEGGIHVRNKDIPWFFPPNQDVGRMVDFFNAIKIPATNTADYDWRRVKKFLVNTTGNLFSVVSGKNCHDMLSDHFLQERMRATLRETLRVLRRDTALARAWTVAPSDDDQIEKEVFEAMHTYGHHFPSSQQDYAKGNKVEIDSLNGYIVQVAHRLGTTAPHNELLTDQARAKVKARLHRNIEEAEWEARVDLAACYRLADQFGFSDIVWNHITMQVPGEKKGVVLVARYGMRYDEITASNLLKVDLNEAIVLDGGSDPRLGQSKITNSFGTEAPVNFTGLIIHRSLHNNQDASTACVMHAHPVAAMALAATKAQLTTVSQDHTAFHGLTGYHPYEGVSCDADEEARLRVAMKDNIALVMRNHGAITVGASVGEAFTRMYYLNKCCEVQLKAMASGAELLHVEDSTAARARAWYNEYSQQNKYIEFVALKRSLIQRLSTFAC